VWPHAQRTAERRQHTCSALLPRRNIGSEVVAICLCSDKMKYKYGRGIYRYEMWLSLALKIMALSTQLHWSTFHTHKICTSEQNWPSSWRRGGGGGGRRRAPSPNTGRNRQLDPKGAAEDPPPGPGQEGRNRGQGPGAGPGGAQETCIDCRNSLSLFAMAVGRQMS